MQSEPKYIGRAGLKLEFALSQFHIDVSDSLCADFGANVGGFTDCLLQQGARSVYAIDTSYGTLDWKLRNDSRVIVLERTNAMHVTLPDQPVCIAIDVAWTRQDKILPNALRNLHCNGIILSLVKTQYEAERHELEKGTLKKELIQEVVNRCKQRLSDLGIHVAQEIQSPFTGGKGGNIEYFFFIQQSDQRDLSGPSSPST